MREAFDLFIVEGETPVAIEQAIHTRQHFPSLEIVALTEDEADASGRQDASNQNVELVPTDCSDRRLRDRLRAPVAAFERTSGPAAERIDPCRSLVGNLNQFSAAEILQMSCLSQRSGRFAFKSGRGNSEIFLHHGTVPHATYGSIEDEAAVAKISAGGRATLFAVCANFPATKRAGSSRIGTRSSPRSASSRGS